MDKLNDQHFINLVIGGDTHAFAILVDRYKNLVFTLSVKMLQSQEEAEEAAQVHSLKYINRWKNLKVNQSFPRGFIR